MLQQAGSDGDPIQPNFLIRVRNTVLVPAQEQPIEGIDSLKAEYAPEPDIQFKTVPIVKIFGVTSGGQKACLNIHGAWPYLFVEYPRERSVHPESALRYCARLGRALDTALSSQGREKYLPNIHKVEICKGVPFYGYHVGYSFFLKISYRNPSSRFSIINLLEMGAVLGKKFQIFEGHLNFSLQFMCDYGLVGCDWVDIEDARFRQPILEPTSSQEDNTFLHYLKPFTSVNTPDNLLHPYPQPPRTARDQLVELDIHVSAIMNRHKIRERQLHHDFIELKNPDSFPGKDEKLLNSLREIWNDEKRRRAEKGLSSEGIYPKASDERIGRAAEAPGRDAGWQSDEYLWGLLEDKVKAERANFMGHSIPGLDDYVAKNDGDVLLEGKRGIKEWGPKIRTAFATITNICKVGPLPSAAVPHGTFQPYSQPRYTQPDVSQRHNSLPELAPVSEDEPLQATLSPSPPPAQQHPINDDFQVEEFEDPYDTAAFDFSQDAEVPANPLEDLKEDLVMAASQKPPVPDDDHVDGDDDDEKPIEFGDEDEEDVNTLKYDEMDVDCEDQMINVKGKKKAVDVDLDHDEFGDGDETKVQIDADKEIQSSNNTATSQHPNAESSKQVPLVVYPPTMTPRPSKLTLEKSPSKSASPSPRHQYLSTSKNKKFSLAATVATTFPAVVPPTPTYISTPTAEVAETRPPTEESTASTRSTDEMAPPATQLPRSNQVANTRSDLTSSRDLKRSLTSQESSLEATAKRARFEDSGSSSAQGEVASKSMPTSSTTAISSFVGKATTGEDHVDMVDSSTSIPSGFSNASAEVQRSSYAFTSRAHLPGRATLVDDFYDQHKDDYHIYKDPFYSKPEDVPTISREFAGKKFTLKGEGLEELELFGGCLPEWLPPGHRKATTGLMSLNIKSWKGSGVVPTRGEVTKSLKEDQLSMIEKRRRELASQIHGPTQKNLYGFKFTQPNPADGSSREKQHMSILSLEVMAQSRGKLKSNVETDEIIAIFYCLQTEDPEIVETGPLPGYHVGMIVVDSEQSMDKRITMDPYIVEIVKDELELINLLTDKIRFWDPDVLAGWEIQASSWGYLQLRFKNAFASDFLESISPLVEPQYRKNLGQYDEQHTANIQVTGRHVLNIWRLMRGEFNLNQYSFEHVVAHVLHRRIPHFSTETLNSLFYSKTAAHTNQALNYVLLRAILNMELLEISEEVTKKSEFARVYGIDFRDVYSRGSQYKVEAFMFRIAKPENFLLPTPNRNEVAGQNALEALAMVMEPQSNFYKGPLVVVDFQSLYPSIMIAYNICYSTCLGKINTYGEDKDKFGTSKLNLPLGTVEMLKDHMTITPNGMMFVKPDVRKSLLAKMLGEILDTRVMVKHAMKGYRNNNGLTKLLNARQLALKLLANVTYGYTSASYSGRMPNSQIADAIVQTGRETLERAIVFIENTKKWSAKVVYGDTDSLFIYLPGRTKDQAFQIGNEIADAVTASNPKPVKLKFEKIYLPCTLIAKKHYVGFKYEFPDQVEPDFDAKGIETVRRDGIPAGQKFMETCIKILFRTQDLSLVEEHCRIEWTKILKNRVSIQDFIFAKEVKMGTYSDKIAPQPGVALAAAQQEVDPSNEVQYGQRVPYLITSGAPGSTLNSRTVSPLDMIRDRTLSLDAEYYIKKRLIPPIERVFSLLGANVPSWYQNMPRPAPVVESPFRDVTAKKKYATIDNYLTTVLCALCKKNLTGKVICASCMADKATAATALLYRHQAATARMLEIQRICASCSHTPASEASLCESIDCNVLYDRTNAKRECEDVARIPEFVKELLPSDNHQVSRGPNSKRKKNEKPNDNEIIVLD